VEEKVACGTRKKKTTGTNGTEREERIKDERNSAYFYRPLTS
jgi:hypothetical protein